MKQLINVDLNKEANKLLSKLRKGERVISVSDEYSLTDNIIIRLEVADTSLEIYHKVGPSNKFKVVF